MQWVKVYLPPLSRQEHSSDLCANEKIKFWTFRNAIKNRGVSLIYTFSSIIWGHYVRSHNFVRWINQEMVLGLSYYFWKNKTLHGPFAEQSLICSAIITILTA